MKAQIETLSRQLAVKDKQIEAQTEQVKQTSILLSQAHTLTLQAQKSKGDASDAPTVPKKTQETSQAPAEDTHGWIWKMFH